MASNLSVELEGVGKATLSAANHLATGGEASVYNVAGNLIVKVYTDPRKMARDGMVDKVDLLKPLGTETIIAPQGVVTDKKTSKPVGFFMPKVQGESMARVFTTAFWRSQAYTVDLANITVEKMRKAVEHAHANNAVMVDANELNWMLTVGSDPIPRVIDVDSWAIGKWGASVIMPSIRDWHNKSFDAKSDWFSWGVVTFQMYTGIHPYRGTLDGYKASEWEKRMKDNASVFSPGVRLNAAVRDLNAIPSALRGWYEATFQKGERTLPPSPFAAATAQKAAIVHHISVGISTGALVFDKIFDVYPVMRVWSCGAVLVRAGAELQIWESKRKKKLFDVPPYMRFTEVIRVEGGWVLAILDGISPRFFFTDDTSFKQIELVDLKLNGNALFRFEDRLFISTDTNLIELKYLKLAKPILAIKQQISVLHPQAIQWFDGVGVERAFEATFVITPMRDTACATVRVKELDGLQVIDAKAGTRFAVFLAEDKLGNIVKVELAFDADHTTYSVVTENFDSHELNMACLPKGVCATIIKDGELQLFAPSLTKKNVRVVSDKAVTTSLSLDNIGDTVVYVDRGALWSLKMR